MTITFISSVTATRSGNTVTLSLTGTTTGNQIVVGVTWWSVAAQTIASISCSGESDLTLHGSVVRNPTDGHNTQLASLGNITGSGTKTIVVTFSGTPGNGSAVAAEFAGGDTTTWFDAVTPATGDTGQPTANVTSANNNALVVGVSISSIANTTGSGYTDAALNDPSYTAKFEYKLDAGTAGSQTVDWTGSTATWAMQAATFNAVDLNHPRTPSVGSLSLTGVSPSVSKFITTSVGSAVIEGVAPFINSSASPTAMPVVGCLTLTGNIPTATIGISRTIIPTVGDLGISGVAPTSSAAIATGTFNLLLRTLSAEGSAGAHAELDLLLRTISASAVSGIVASAAFATPLRTLDVTANYLVQYTSPLRTLVATGVNGVVGRITWTAPVRTLFSTGQNQLIGNAAFSLLLRSLSSSDVAGVIGVNGIIANLNFGTPLRTLFTAGSAGIIANASFHLLLRTLHTGGYPQLIGSASFLLPLRYMIANGFPSVVEHYRTWVLNASSKALSEYDNQAMNSMARFGSAYLMAGPDGIFLMGGDDDDGEEIAAVIRTGKLEYGSTFLKRIPRLYFSGSQEGDLIFSTITSEDGKRTYNLLDNGIVEEQQRRVPVGKGPKSSRFALEVANKDGAGFGASKILVYPQKLRRRIQ